MQPLSLPVSKKQLRTAAVSAMVLSLCSSLTAVAAEPDNKQPEWGLGGAVISKQRPYKGIDDDENGVDRDVKAIPFIYFENEYVRVFGPGIDLKLPSYKMSASQQLDFSLVGQFDFSGYDDDDIDDTPILTGMHERKGGFWAGAKVEWHVDDIVDVSAEWLADVSGHSEGKRFSLGVERIWSFDERFMLTPRIKAIWQDEKYIDYYYGVRSDEVRAGRAAYKGDSGMNLEFGARGTYMFNKQHSVFLDLEVTRLADEIKDSPLVDRSTENSVLFGYMYRF